MTVQSTVNNNGFNDCNVPATKAVNQQGVISIGMETSYIDRGLPKNTLDRALL